METAQWAGAIDNVGGELLTWLTRTVDFWGNIASIGLAGSHELKTTVMPFILRGVNLLGINSVATPRELRLAVWQRLATRPATVATRPHRPQGRRFRRAAHPVRRLHQGPRHRPHGRQDRQRNHEQTRHSAAAGPRAGDKPLVTPERLTHLQRLEAESIQIMREVVAECDKPVMLYSIGKDSAAMLHVALKAFYPAPPPFPLLHVDTLWKFQAMYELRAEITQRYKLQLIVHTNPDGVAQGINPFTHGSAVHTDVMKTQALKQALDLHGFDAAFGGARRDEEKSRAKERVFSFRSAQHRWDPKNQRPELWSLYNTRMHKGESMRVFPMSNWTELDIWQYIYLHDIPIVPLYFAAERPVVERDGTLIMVDDDRMPLRPGREADAEEGALPHARLLPADRRDRERGRHAHRDHPGDAADARRPSGRAA